MKISFCSPSNDGRSVCFNSKTLEYMINVWNNNNKTNKIVINNVYNSYSVNNKYYYILLNNKLKNILGNNKYWLWCGYLYHLPYNTNAIKLKLKKIDKKELRPEKPESWYKNPRTWLSNYDIQNVMNQYQNTKKYKYAFLGVFPIDFSVKLNDGRCAYNSLCNIDIKNYLTKNFIGLITNLDKHDEPGSHWTSTFFCINPKLPSYGAYYYDSTSRPIPPLLLQFINDIKRQCDALYPKNTFNIIYNKKQHQFKNSECGVFSLLFQIRWINKHIVKHNNTSFQEIISNPSIKDEQMTMIRDYIFRPNTKIELKKMHVI